MKRTGPFLLTFTGRRFWPLDPRPEDIALEDIAHALSMLCRFGGHVGLHYSVAEHSVRIAEAILEETGDVDRALEGLFHDAAEAYTGDFIWPVKQALKPYLQDLERGVDRAVRVRFGLAPSEPRMVKRFDLILLATEKRDLGCRALLFPTQTDEWLAAHGYENLADYEAMRDAVFGVKREQIIAETWGSLGEIAPLPGRIWPWSAQNAEGKFMAMATGLLLARTAPRIPPESPSDAAYCTVCGRRLEPVRAVADGSPTLRGHHPCPDHPEAR